MKFSLIYCDSVQSIIKGIHSYIVKGTKAALIPNKAIFSPLGNNGLLKIDS